MLIVARSQSADLPDYEPSMTPLLGETACDGTEYSEVARRGNVHLRRTTVTPPTKKELKFETKNGMNALEGNS